MVNDEEKHTSVGSEISFSLSEAQKEGSRLFRAGITSGIPTCDYKCWTGSSEKQPVSLRDQGAGPRLLNRHLYVTSLSLCYCAVYQTEPGGGENEPAWDRHGTYWNQQVRKISMTNSTLCLPSQVHTYLLTKPMSNLWHRKNTCSSPKVINQTLFFWCVNKGVMLSINMHCVKTGYSNDGLKNP